MRKIVYRRREALALGGISALGLGLSAAHAADGDKPLPKGPKIGPPPVSAKGEDENGAEEDLRAAELVGLQLRVVKPGQVVTQDYNEGRVTVVVDKNNTITELRIG